MRRWLLVWGILTICCAAAPVRAQRVTGFPGGLADGPWGGQATFNIGEGGAPAGAILALRLCSPERVVCEAAVGQVPCDATLDLSAVADGEYSLQLVALRPGAKASVVWERWPVTVQGGVADSAAPRVRPADTTPAVGVRFARRVADNRRPPVGGVLDLRIDGRASGSLVPQVVVEQSGRVVSRIVAAPNGVARWDTRDMADGAYVARLVLVDLDNAAASEREMDRLELTVRNAAPVRTYTPPQIDRGSLPSRGGLARVAGRKDGAALILSLSKMAGDRWPRVAAAQWALESGWGKSPSGRNNYFGIKSWDGSGTLRDTHEWVDGQSVATTARFADYATLYDGIAARVAFLKKPRYAAYWSATTEEEACRALQSAGYATTPTYAAQLIGLLGNF